MLTRQLNHVTFKNEMTKLSKEQALILPSLNDKIPPGTVIPNEVLYQALNATPQAECYDVCEKDQVYSQRINWEDYATGNQLYSSEKEFLLASLLNHEDALKLDTVRDIFSIKASNKSFQQRAGKLQFLSQVKEKLSKLPANSMELQRITTFINAQLKKLGL